MPCTKVCMVFPNEWTLLWLLPFLMWGGTLSAQSPYNTENQSIEVLTPDSNRHKMQWAVWPGVGTLGKADKHALTDYSFFLLGGRSASNLKWSMAGLFSKTGVEQRGLQLSGLANVGRGRVHGLQVAGLYNRADTLNGVQIGFLNAVDTVAGGLPVGVFSYVKKGYHLAEFTFDETFRFNLAVQSGLRHFHNIVAFGYGHRNEGLQAWYVGYGLGSAPKLGERVALHVQLIAMWIDNADPATFNMLNRLAVGLDYSLGDRFSVYAGMQINGMVYETGTSFPSYILPQRRQPLYREPIGDGYTFHVYPGARIGLRVHW